MRKKHESWCSNFMLRFFYEFFLEFCIVVMIGLSVRDFSEFSPSFSYFSAILITLTTIVVFAILIYHLFRDGPYTIKSLRIELLQKRHDYGVILG